MFCDLSEFSTDAFKQQETFEQRQRIKHTDCSFIYSNKYTMLWKITDWYLEHDVRRSLLDNNRHIIRMSVLLFFICSINFIIECLIISRGLVCLCKYCKLDYPFIAICYAQCFLEWCTHFNTTHWTWSL